MNEPKFCNGCQSEKDVSEFRLRKSKKGFVRVSICKVCEREESVERLRNGRQADPERFKAYAKKKYEKHKEKINLHNMLNYFKNIIARKAKRKAYYEANREKAIKDAVEWRKHNPQISTNRRARVRQAEGKFTKKEWFALCEKFDNRCVCCREKKPLTADHVIPLAKGGTNYISNIQPLCRSCNSAKHTDIVDYRTGWLQCVIG